MAAARWRRSTKGRSYYRKYSASEKNKAYRRNYYAKSADQQQRVKERNRKQYLKNRIFRLLYQRLYYAKHRSGVRNYTAQATERTKAIAESLVTLFLLLPNNHWRQQLAKEILESNSGQTLCWVNSQLEDLIVEHTGEI